MVSGELAGECLQTGFERHGLPPQRAPLDTAYPLREHLNSVQRMVSGGYCEGLFPDTVGWTRLRNIWNSELKDLLLKSFHYARCRCDSPQTTCSAGMLAKQPQKARHWHQVRERGIGVCSVSITG